MKKTIKIFLWLFFLNIAFASGGELTLGPTCTLNWPSANPEFSPLVLDFPINKEINDDFGVLSAQEKQPGVSPMFFAPALYPVDQIETKGLPLGLNMHIVLEGEFYHLFLSGQPSMDVKNSQVIVTALNEYSRELGPCPNNTITFHLFFRPTVTMIPSQMPWVVLNKEMFPSNYAIFTAANGGTISAISIAPINTTSSHPLSYYGVSYNPAPLLSKLSGDLRLTGTVTQPTFVKQAYQVSVTNSEGEVAKATFDLVIQGVPVVADANLGSGSYARGQAITPISLSSHFKNPLQSGSINYVLSDSTGDQGSAVTAKYGVSVQNGQLVGKVPAAAPSGTVQIYVQGQNMIGVSGRAYYSLTIG